MRDFQSGAAVLDGDAGQLAEAARTLAVECAERRAPPMIVGNRHGPDGGHCALGWLEARCDMKWFPFFAANALRECVAVAAANNDAEDHGQRQERLVPALLALADACEAAAKPSPEAQSAVRAALAVRREMAMALVPERA